jgi:hypothetical protein
MSLAAGQKPNAAVLRQYHCRSYSGGSGRNRYWLRTVQHVVNDDQRKHNSGCYYRMEWLAVDLVALNHLKLTDIA